MSLKTRPSYWGLLSGLEIWLLMVATVFVVLMFVYQLLVSPTADLQDYVLPNSAQAVSPFPKAKEVELDDDQLINSFVTTNPLHSIEKAVAPASVIHYEIKPGNTLARIFSRLGLSKQSMYEVLEADQEYLVLEPLIPGNKFTFELNSDGELIKLTRRIDLSKSIAFVRHDNGGYSYEEHVKPITYVQTAVHGNIKGSFYLSAKKVNLSDSNILIIHNLLKGRFNFSRDLRTGDTFDFVLKDGNIDGKKIGETQLEALQMTVKGKTYHAFLHTDGRYYDQDGKGLTPALRHWPTAKHYRVSSPFNAHRLHPITGHPAPHNGVDLATPIGTKILATGDGIVTRVATHKYAGKYVVIDYSGPYSARFLHLQKVLVKKGQKVKRGQVIALSGNTGRTTGAHLHYELHVKGRPVNPMTAKIPTAQSVPKDEMADYSANVASWIQMMDTSAS
ncbi:peptidoglycan DD-metalloendopeptidase family protein [Marinomonas transparens]|uniref:Peptidoglycan DD-metalloendopeptidase family protein n=1 Tax=Marinomonas transparens TaxID=2795388 RepID=A0A934JMK2_9GAMM|nr:peptidoglycan DD-metalloendopeptidase family protein [Marinomonas transparens]MBJ7538561.1 peptidoglycan DD-metalloendopeptidase family protein [Marinomonas transparens]